MSHKIYICFCREYVRVGEHTIDATNDCSRNYAGPECFVEDIPIESVLIHQQYSSQINDIALIRMKRNFTKQRNARTICLPIFDYQSQIREQERFSVAGWGVTDENNIQSLILQKTYAHFVKNDDCIEEFRKLTVEHPKVNVKISNESICATGIEGSDA
jgi:Trypsin